MVSPSFPLSRIVMGLEATAFDNPVIVTTELSVAAKFASVTIVTVIVFDCPARGLLWPIFFVVKDAAQTVEQERHKTCTKIPTTKIKERLIFGRLDWSVDEKNDRSRIAKHTIVKKLCELHVLKASPLVSSRRQGRKRCALALLVAGSWRGLTGLWKCWWCSVRRN